MNTQDFETKGEATSKLRKGMKHLAHSSDCGCTAAQVEAPKLPTALAAIGAVSALLVACKKEQIGLYELEPVPLVGSAADKDKLKTNQQFVSILYTNLFQAAISSSNVFELDELFQSIGDKEIAKEVLISNYFNNAGVQLPTVEEMNADLEAFVENTYKRFLVRLPNEAEKTWVKNFIQSNSYMTPELVYFSFALSNEYQYY